MLWHPPLPIEVGASPTSAGLVYRSIAPTNPSVVFLLQEGKILGNWIAEYLKAKNQYFNSHTLCGVWPGVAAGGYFPWRFQLSHPVRGVTKSHEKQAHKSMHFNSHALCGVWRCATMDIFVPPAFQLSRPVRGVTGQQSWLQHNNSISTLTPRAWRDQRLTSVSTETFHFNSHALWEAWLSLYKQMMYRVLFFTGTCRKAHAFRQGDIRHNYWRS